MPSINKPGGGITLGFAAKNEDVRLILVELKKKKINLTDYICNAVRFYEENKDKTNTSSINIAELVRIEVEKQLKDIKIPSLIAEEEKAIDLEDVDDLDDSFCEED